MRDSGTPLLRDVITAGGFVAAAAAFGMLGRDDAAFAGFADSLHTRLYSPNSNPNLTTLDRHTEAVVNGLRNGKRVMDAVNDANGVWPPMKYPAPGPYLGMEFVGDPWARLVNVYVSESEDGALHVWEDLKYSWYWFMP